MAVRHLTGPAHTEDRKRTQSGRLTPICGCCVRQQGDGGERAALYVREWEGVGHNWWLLAHTVRQWITAPVTQLRSPQYSCCHVSTGWSYLNAWERLTKPAHKRLKETLLLFFFLISNWLRVRGIISTAWKEKGNGKLLLSLKHQGVSFIMKDQRKGKCEAAVLQCLCFCPFVLHRRLHGITGDRGRQTISFSERSLILICVPMISFHLWNGRFQDYKHAVAMITSHISITSVH